MKSKKITTKGPYPRRSSKSFFFHLNEEEKKKTFFSINLPSGVYYIILFCTCSQNSEGCTGELFQKVYMLGTITVADSMPAHIIFFVLQ